MPNLIILGRTVFEKNPMLTLKKFNVAEIVVIINFEFEDTTMLYFFKFFDLLEHLKKNYIEK